MSGEVMQVSQHGLRILIPCNRVPNNPYFFQLIRGLDGQPAVASVQYDTDWLRFPETPFDVIHVQWPEALVGWREPTKGQVEAVRAALDEWRSRGAIVAVTVHNEAPHGKNTESFRALYEMVYGRCDLFVHFGEASVRIIEKHGALLPHAEHAVIPHGNYEWFLRAGVSPGGAVKRAGFRMVSVGRIRSQAEVDLLEAVADALRPLQGELVVLGRLPHPSRLGFGHFRTRAGAWRRSNLILREAFATDVEMAAELSQADAVLVPRINSLNSGNVPLAFTFGRVAIGPNQGVIGEELARLGNPVFDPQSRESIGQAVAAAVELATRGDQGQRNKRYAMEALAWPRVAEAHVAAYVRCLSHRRAEQLAAGI